MNGSKSPAGIEVLQINLQHSQGATAALSRCMAKLQTKIALIQEPWVYRHQVRGLRERSSILFVGTGEQRPRACVLTSRTLYPNMLQQFSNQDMVAVEIQYLVSGNWRKIIVASVYLPYDSPQLPPGKEFTLLVDYCSERRIPLLVGCDANAHHLLWGSTDTNKRGQALAEYLASTNLNLLNRGSEPTFVVARRQEVIDITLCSHELNREIVNWHVSSEASLSDHRQIRFRLEASSIPTRMYRNPRTTNWAQYTRDLSEALGFWISRCTTVEDIEWDVATVQRTIMDSYERSCTPRREKVRTVPWWNGELQDLRRDARRKWNQAKRSLEPTDWNEYQKAQRAYKRLIRLRKRQCWQNYCSGIEKMSEATRLRRALCKDPLGELGFLKLPNGQYTSDRKETFVHLLETHFPGCKTREERTDTQELNHFGGFGDCVLARRVVTPDRVRWAVTTFEPYKSPGPDGIYPVLLQKGLDVLLPILVRIFRSCLSLGYIPKPWREIKVVFIPKPGRTSYDLAKSFRPISLSSFMLKTMERLVDRFVRDSALLTYPLHSNQHAYQSGKSVDTALHELVSRIERAMDSKLYTLGVFLDIEGAFDNTTFESICEGALEHGIPRTIVRWVDATLRLRNISAGPDLDRITVTVTKGCPQGGVLSPLLWSLVVDGLLKRLAASGLYSQGYADDLAVLVTGRFLDTVCALMQNGLSMIEQWCHQYGLRVNPQKTEMVLFTNRRKIEAFKAPIFYEVSLQRTDQVKYLGLILDQKLNWKAHVERVCQKATVAFWQCRRAIGRTWGFSPKITRWLYTAVIRPMVAYASLIWWPRVELASVRASLGQVQRIACLSITSAMCTTPTAAMEVMLDLPPLHFFVEAVARATAYRLNITGKWNVKGKNVGHNVISHRVRSNPTLQMPCDYIVHTFVFDRLYTVQFPSRTEWEKGKDKLVSPPGIECYTDGSRLLNKSGAGVYRQGSKQGQSFALGKLCTVFQAEVYAILQCCRSDELTGLSNETIYICSDSQAALRALNSPKVTSKLVLECMLALQELSRENTVTLIWVPGHCGIEGNESADQAARLGAKTVVFGPEPVLAISRSIARLEFQHWIRDQHIKYWESLSTCRQAKSFLEKPCKTLTEKLLTLERRSLRTVVGLLTGHCPLNKHLTNIGINNNPMCEKCSLEEEDAIHFLCNCEGYGNLRERFFDTHYPEPLSLTKVPLQHLLKFIKTSKRLANGTYS